MATYREMVYMVLDELKAKSDDFYYTEDHIIFLLDKYRAFLLKQKYSDIKKQIPQSNFQVLVIPIPIESNIPNIINISIPQVKTNNKNYSDFNFCSENRFSYIGLSKYNKNSVYFIFKTTEEGITLDFSDSFNQEGVNTIYIKAVFESPCKVYEFQDKEVIDELFPLEESLISPLLEMVIKDLTSAIFKPEDNTNNSKDDLGSLNNFMYQNSKSDLAKQIYG